MSKTHLNQSQSDIDAELDQFLADKKVKPIVSSASEGIDLFGGHQQKKKSWLQRLLTYLHLPSLA